jgi:glycosyltransferase involved in cell wall biosynthesis
MSNPRFLLIEGSDFETFPAGGQLTMARSLMKLFGDQMALVGMSRRDGPTGRWIKKEISGVSYSFFAVCRREPSSRKPVIPARLTFYIALRQFKQRILSLQCRAAFIQAPEALIAASRWNWDNLCYRFAGVENPLKISRYPFARPLWKLFDRSLFSALDRADLVLATADHAAIEGLVSRSNGRLPRERIRQFPTSVDTSLFRPMPARLARSELGIPANCTLLVSSGRIGRFKGWELILDAFANLLKRNPDALLFFVGDGEDRPLLQAQIQRRKLGTKIVITGFQQPQQVRSYLNAADVVVFGSFIEGWPTAMLEALACGKALVSTEVSGAHDLILPGRNGYIVNNRDCTTFADAVENAMHLPESREISTLIAAQFDLAHLKERLTGMWAPLSRSEF